MAVQTVLWVLLLKREVKYFNVGCARTNYCALQIYFYDSDAESFGNLMSIGFKDVVKLSIDFEVTPRGPGTSNQAESFCYLELFSFLSNLLLCMEYFLGMT